MVYRDFPSDAEEYYGSSEPDSPEGMWILYRVEGGKRTKLTTIQLPEDCWGDDLYKYLEPFLPPGKTLDEYEFEGDQDSIAVWSTDKTGPEFYYRFIPAG